jgi:LCP family protein required for cell wall assembly
VVLAVPALVIVATGAFAVACWMHITRVPITFPGSPPGGTTYVLVGSDSRAFVQNSSDRATFGTPTDAPGQHADAVLLVRISDGGHVAVMPIPRDLLVQLPDGAPTRLTMSLLQGPQAVVGTLCHSLGVGVNHLVLVHMNGLRNLVDDVGGVSIRVPTPERDTVTGLSITRPGWNHLDGAQALAYVRSRHLQYLVDGSWQPAATAQDERSGRAAQVLSLVGARLDLGPGAPLTSARRLWELSGAITVDRGASPLALNELAGALGQLHAAAQVTLPVTLRSGYVPVADLDPGGAAALNRFNGGSTPGCSLRSSISSSSPATAAGPTVPGGTSS